MGRERAQWRKALGPPGAVARALAVLLVICLVECSSEQRINSRGSKTPNLIEKSNGWRSQRGGSCLSYGHSCWGAHGKRSGPPPELTKLPDWYLLKLLRRMASPEMKQEWQPAPVNRDLHAIFQVGNSEDESNTNSLNDLESVENAAETPRRFIRRPEGIPMLDDTISNTKFMQLMRDAAVNK